MSATGKLVGGGIKAKCDAWIRKIYCMETWYLNGSGGKNGRKIKIPCQEKY